VIPHGSSVYSYHLQFANTNCPIAEYLVLAPQADEILPLFGTLFVDEPLPKNGYVGMSALFIFHFLLSV
jgi:L-rhamnonate dehydratase